MINKTYIRGFFGLLSVILLLVFIVFGKPKSPFWSSYYFLVVDIIVLWLTSTVKTKDKLVKIAVKCIFVIFLICLGFDGYSFFDKFVFKIINSSYLIGGFVLLTVIFYAYGMAKRKIQGIDN